ncbi:MAG: SUMF1/EgtB/PvdO family nonheme iron enzyme [Candidatus Delongbacteria bacterium]|nr:SUMF1/EgtB/PvdO family nonheme iron enzyme [Candidatus Delongbacteria bacterium]
MMVTFFACSEREHTNPLDSGYWDSDKAPSNVNVEPLSLTSAKLSWTDNSSEEQFIIERKFSSSTTWTEIGEVEGDKSTGVTKTYTDNAQVTGTIYNYRVYAVYNEAISNMIESPSYSATLPAPTGLTATIASETSIKLDWTDNSTGEDGFKIDRKIGAAGTWVTDFATVGANVKTYTNTGLTTGTTYYYRVRAYYSTYYSNYTSEVNGYLEQIFIEIPTGSFSMGQDGVATPVHTVNITRPFYLGKYEVTQQEWLTTMGSNPSYFTGDLNRPVEVVSWYNILVYCNTRSIAEGLTPCYTISGTSDPEAWGSIPTSSNATWDAVFCDFDEKGYRLPTEAEWEYAARYNDGRTYPWGETAPSSTLCNYNSNVGATTAVGSYPSGNSNLGLCDMAGNVWEWVWDWKATYPSETQTDPSGPDTAQSSRVLRGGGWNNYNALLRCAIRYEFSPYSYGSGVGLNGLRLARTKW